jgi:serine/threonine protein kinase
LEYVVGGEFFTHLRAAGRLGEPSARFYAAETLLALEHLHEKGVIYRDLKVKNEAVRMRVQ